MAAEVFKRLPRLCVPIRYAIELKPCLKSFTFTGKQSVSLDMAPGASELVLNAKKLNVDCAKFNGMAVEVISKPEEEKIVIPLAHPSLAGSATLDLEFKGEIGDKMLGFYRSMYSTETEDKKVMLSTHFEPSNARLVFPCWDEPDFKAVFSVTLVVPNGLTAISNMPVISQQEVDGNCTSFVFSDTPKMSSYLVAFAVGELEFVEAFDSDSVRIRVYSRPGLLSECGRGDLALDTACRSLPFFGDYFRTRYPLPKLDLLAVPDFAGGAMENWGLVTFRERALLAEKGTASPSSMQSIALTIDHELAHMWFGNLVTMHWWTDLWLKEGFATWIAYLCVNHCFPEMEIWTHFTYSELASALRLDALVNSHPIEVEVSNPDEIDEIFDTISYCKGASLIHMLHAFLGDDAFRAGLCGYLAKHAYDNANTEDLWSALEAASGLQVASIMRPWTQTSGFPVVIVKPLRLQGDRIYLHLQQVQYRLPSIVPVDASRVDQIWPIPIVLTCYSADGQSRVTHKYILKESEITVDFPLTWSATNLADCLVHLNADATGFYHSCYSEDQLHQLASHFDTMGWSTPVKVAFINDGFALSRAGYIRISYWLSILPQLLANERSYSVWRCALSDGLGVYVRRLVHEDDLSVSNYNSYLRKLVCPVLEKCGFFNPDPSHEALSHDARRLRSLLVVTAGAEACDKKTIEEAERRYNLYHSGKDLTAVSGDLRGAIYTTVVRHAESDVIQQLMEAYRFVKSPEEQSDILIALGAATEKAESLVGGDPVSPLQRVLKFCLDPAGPVRDQDRILGLHACASWSAAARRATWHVVKSEWPRLQDIYRGQFLLAYLIKGVLNGFSSEPHILDAKAFFEKNPVTCPRALNQAHETMDTNLFLLRRDLPAISSFLERFASVS